MTKKELKKSGDAGLQKIIPSFHIEADAKGMNMSLLIAGIIGVKSFSESAVLVASKRDLIEVGGSLLKIAVLENNAVEISGKIDNISFYRKKKRGRNL